MVKHLPAMWDTWVQSLGWEDPLEKEMATHSSTLAWKIPWMEEPGRLYSLWRCKELNMTERLHFQSPSAVISEPKKIKSVTVPMQCRRPWFNS